MDEVIRGYNVTVFAYGQTGSGKTHTMTGDAGSPGIATLAFEHLFSSIRGESFAYSLFVHSFHARRYRVVLFATVQFVWRGRAKKNTTRAGPWPDFALLLE